MTGMNSEELSILETKLGYNFRRPELLVQALTHASYAGEQAGPPAEAIAGKDNQQLEFLGDAVLELGVRGHLMRRFPDMPEGGLARLRAVLVSKRTLGTVARTLNLGSFLRLGKGEEKTKGRAKTSILADAYEAVVAAIYLDGGTDAAFRALEHHFFPVVEDIIKTGYLEDYKTRLQELIQSRFKTTPIYRLCQESGHHHEKVFEAEILVQAQSLGRGQGSTKKEAEQNAAKQALEKMQL